MNNIKILDCTLRDGGYINNFSFGAKSIKNIIKKLTDASIDIVECGFLRSDANDKDCSLYPDIESIASYIQKKKTNVMYVAMLQYGKISNEEIVKYDGKSIDGIRLTFHEHEIQEALTLGKQLQEKGYKVFMQPVGTTTYTDETLLKLISEINKMKPYAFYMVDTLGTMYKKDLLRMFFLIDHNLDSKIAIGFHSHNNLQLAFSNAMELMQMNTQRQIIIDSSVYGMGRGAGNLCTELITHYINENIALKYNNLDILEVIDQYIKPLRRQFAWGYDVVYYIASVNGCHPNYAQYLLNLQTLHVQDIHAILNNMNLEKKALYDKEYIEEQYLKYMNHYIDDKAVIDRFSKIMGNKKILILAPGKSINYVGDEIGKIIEKEQYLVISVNFVPSHIPVDIVFMSNMKRYENMEALLSCITDKTEIIITSNIRNHGKGQVSVINYSEYLNEEQIIVDNAGVMCINFVRKLGCSDILLAGFDGFSSQLNNNYCEDNMIMNVDEERLQSMNEAFSRKLKQMRQVININFLTDSMYIEKENSDEKI